MRVLGMGNALVDVMTQLNDEKILNDFNLPKGTMQLVDQAFIGKLLTGTTALKQTLASGGSAANTIHGLAHLGIQTAYIGKTGSDDFGAFFREDMKKTGINPMLLTGEAETGRALALVTPDSERTFATFLGAAIELSEKDIHEDLFKGYDYFHIEGYLVQNNALIRRALELAHGLGLKTSVDMASFNVVEANLAFLKEIVDLYVDIVFANEEEAKSFTGKEPGPALDQIAETADIAVVKLGSKGSLIKQGGKVYEVGVIPATAIDTTGAGDLYAAGFLYGLSENLTLNKCGQIGALLSGRVIEGIGAKLSDDQWKEILPRVEEIVKG